MYQTQTAHDPFTERIIAQFRYYQPLFITDNDVFDDAGAIDQDGELTAKLRGEFYKTGG
jgi:hypothetical protein